MTCILSDVWSDQDKQFDAMTNFMYGLGSPESRRQYPARFKVFLDFLELEGTVSEQASQFMSRAVKLL